jgi:hypothetical protein
MAVFYAARSSVTSFKAALPKEDRLIILAEARALGA